MRTLRFQFPMMRGPDVEQVQRITGVSVDGLFGPQTEIAVADFQRRMGLAPDGIVGQKTWQAISEFTGEEPVVVEQSPLNTVVQAGPLLPGSTPLITSLWIAGSLVLIAGIAVSLQTE